MTRKDSDIIGLPVVCSRLFRFSSFYVNKKSKIKTAKDLKGKKVGSPEWAHTAAVYMRGWLNDEHGVGAEGHPLGQAGTNEAGRIEKVELSLPKGVKLTRVKDKSLSDMLASGEIDCAIIARPPDCFRQGHKDVVRLYPGFLGDGGEVLQGRPRSGRSCTSSRCKSACSTKIPGWRAISTTPSSPRRTAASSG